MKTFKLYILLLLSSLALVSCNDDDEFYNIAYLNKPDLVAIDIPLAGYNVNDNLTFHIDFSRYQTEGNHATPLDLYKTTGAESFGFNYYLEKKTGTNTWTTVFSNEDEYRVGEVEYMPLTETYEFDEALPLTSAGEYRFRLGISDFGYTKTELISRNKPKQTAVKITTNANGIDSQGYYHFIVN